MFFGLPTATQRALAASLPPVVRLKMSVRSNSAIPAKIVMTIFPEGLVVSVHGSSSDCYLAFFSVRRQLSAGVPRLTASVGRGGSPPGHRLCAGVRLASQARGDRVWRGRFILRAAFRILRRRGAGTGGRGFDPRLRPVHIPTPYSASRASQNIPLNCRIPHRYFARTKSLNLRAPLSHAKIANFARYALPPPVQ